MRFDKSKPTRAQSRQCFQHRRECAILTDCWNLWCRLVRLKPCVKLQHLHRAQIPEGGLS